MVERHLCVRLKIFFIRGLIYAPQTRLLSYLICVSVASWLVGWFDMKFERNIGSSASKISDVWGVTQMFEACGLALLDIEKPNFIIVIFRVCC